MMCLYQFDSLLHKRLLMGSWMFNSTSIKRSSSKAMGVCKGGGVKFHRNDLSPAVLKIKAFKNLLWGIKCSSIFVGFLYVLLSLITKLFAFTNLILCFGQIKRHLMGAWMFNCTVPQSKGRPPKPWGSVRGG